MCESWERCCGGVVTEWNTCLIKPLPPWKRKVRNLSGCCCFFSPCTQMTHFIPETWGSFVMCHSGVSESFSRYIYLHRCQARVVMHVNAWKTKMNLLTPNKRPHMTPLCSSADSLRVTCLLISASPLCVFEDAWIIFDMLINVELINIILISMNTLIRNASLASK